MRYHEARGAPFPVEDGDLEVIAAETDFLGVKREGLLFVSAVYFVGSYAMSKYSQRLERQLGVGER